MLAPDRIQQLHRTLWPDGLPGYIKVFALLDGARDKRIFGAVDASRQDRTCLYSVNSKWYNSDLSWEVIGTAPYLIELDPDEKFTAYLLRNGWDGNWGVYLRAAAGIDRLRRHLRRFLTIATDSGKSLMFRYYDPRVMRVYLPTCSNEEAGAFFGPVSSFLLPARNTDSAIRFRFTGKGLSRDIQRLDQINWRFQDESAPETAEPPSGKRIRLKLRSAQLASLSESRFEDFEERMLDHLNRFFPRQCAAASEEKTRNLIREGIGRAGKYGMRSEREVCRFIDLMMVFGARFDQDSPWAESVLSRPGGNDGRLDELLTAAKASLAIAG